MELDMTPEQAEKLVEKLKKKSLEAEQDFSEKHHAWQIASVAEAINPGLETTKTRELALKELNQAKVEQEQAKARLDGAILVNDAALELAKKMKLDKNIMKAREIGLQREDLATKLESQVGKLVEDFSSLVKLSFEQYELFPDEFKQHVSHYNSDFHEKSLTGYLRQCLFKAGATWSMRYPEDPKEIKSLNRRMAESNEWLFQCVSKAKNGPAT